MNKDVLLERLEKTRAAKREVLAQLHALIGREAELTELIALTDAGPTVG
jgi:hypothetical protein